MRFCLKRSLAFVSCIMMIFSMVVCAFADDGVEVIPEVGIPVLYTRKDTIIPAAKPNGTLLRAVANIQPYRINIVDGTSEVGGIGYTFLADDGKQGNVIFRYELSPGTYQMTASFVGYVQVRSQAFVERPQTINTTLVDTVNVSQQVFKSYQFVVPEGYNFFILSFRSDVGGSFGYSSPNMQQVDSTDNGTFLSRLHLVVVNVLNDVISVGNTIVGNAILLLTVGILLLGGSIGIFGRLLSKR